MLDAAPHTHSLYPTASWSSPQRKNSFLRAAFHFLLEAALLAATRQNWRRDRSRGTPRALFLSAALRLHHRQRGIPPMPEQRGAPSCREHHLTQEARRATTAPPEQVPGHQRLMKFFSLIMFIKTSPRT